MNGCGKIYPINTMSTQWIKNCIRLLEHKKSLGLNHENFDVDLKLREFKKHLRLRYIQGVYTGQLIIDDPSESIPQKSSFEKININEFLNSEGEE